MRFEFAKYTEITDFAFEVVPEFLRKGYVRYFICPDVWDVWLIRVMENVNGEYEREGGSYIMERNNIPHEYKGQRLTNRRLQTILEDDDGSNYDYQQGYNLDNLIDMLDDGFGILNLKK